MPHSDDYEQGFRDGRLASLEEAVKELTKDVSILKTAVYGMMGALALVQFLPMLRDLING